MKTRPAQNVFHSSDVTNVSSGVFLSSLFRYLREVLIRTIYGYYGT